MSLENIAIRPLTLSDSEAVAELEALGFSENERASIKNIHYRLKTCPELCIGLFHREFESFESNPKHSCIKNEKLLGHILATKMVTTSITNESMDIGGHDEHGQIIGLHSLVIHPNYRDLKLASLIMRDYIQRMSQQDVAQSITILAKTELVKFYSKLGFEERGVSNCKHGGEEWIDMVLKLEHVEDEE